MRRAFSYSWCLGAILWVAACASLPGGAEEGRIGYRERGIASWYGGEFHGRRTANGEVYNMHGRTAAHRTLPLGTHLRVTNLENGKDVTVRVNDRGPFIKGRMLDLSYGAATAIEGVGPGTVPVQIEVIGRDEGVSGMAAGQRITPFTLQVGAFAVKENASRLRENLGRKYRDVSIVEYETNSGIYYRVRLGSFPREVAAREFAEKLFKEDGLDPFVTRRD